MCSIHAQNTSPPKTHILMGETDNNIYKQIYITHTHFIVKNGKEKQRSRSE